MAERKMTRETLDRLKKRKAELEAELRRVGAEGSGHQRAGLHDDPGREERVNSLRAQISMIGSLGAVEIIKPRRETDDVGLGNMVKVQFDGETEPEVYTVLGRDDVGFGNREDVVSAESPLGNAIIGHRKGDVVSLGVDRGERRVCIKDIFEGEF